MNAMRSRQSANSSAARRAQALFLRRSMRSVRSLKIHPLLRGAPSSKTVQWNFTDCTDQTDQIPDVKTVQIHRAFYRFVHRPWPNLVHARRRAAGDYVRLREALDQEPGLGFSRSRADGRRLCQSFREKVSGGQDGSGRNVDPPLATWRPSPRSAQGFPLVSACLGGPSSPCCACARFEQDIPSWMSMEIVSSESATPVIALRRARAAKKRLVKYAGTHQEPIDPSAHQNRTAH
jgi:predicted Fe-S protein YdhL (DUF1289 family)